MKDRRATAYYDHLAKWAAFAPRGKKLARLSLLRNQRHNDLREFVRRGPVRDAQLDLFG